MGLAFPNFYDISITIPSKDLYVVSEDGSDLADDVKYSVLQALKQSSISLVSRVLGKIWRRRTAFQAFARYPRASSRPSPSRRGYKPKQPGGTVGSTGDCRCYLLQC